MKQRGIVSIDFNDILAEIHIFMQRRHLYILKPRLWRIFRH